MAYKDLTAAQRQNLSRLANIAATETHRAREDFGVHGKDTARIFLGNRYVTIDEVLTALAAALPAATPDPLKATVTNGTKVNAGSVTGTGNFATFTVAGGAITGIVLSAS